MQPGILFLLAFTPGVVQNGSYLIGRMANGYLSVLGQVFGKIAWCYK